MNAHPLDPLTPAELERAVAIIQTRFPEHIKFILVGEFLSNYSNSLFYDSFDIKKNSRSITVGFF
jgi:Cu2+-containing amine oxidase